MQQEECMIQTRSISVNSRSLRKLEYTHCTAKIADNLEGQKAAQLPSRQGSPDGVTNQEQHAVEKL